MAERVPTTKFPIDVEEKYVLPKVLVPVKLFQSESSVEEAKVQVEVEKEYRRPLEPIPIAPDESPEKLTVPVANRLAVERFPENKPLP